MKKQSNKTSTNPNPSPSLDYQADDKAWYGVRLFLDQKKEKLTLHYCDFPNGIYDLIFFAQDFKDFKQLNEFAARFRPTTVQLQDYECSKVVQGMTVCASFLFGDDDVRFYDAVVVDKINSLEHTFEKGEEVCTCKFVLYWLHGPNERTKTLTKIEHICLIRSETAETDLTLAPFLNLSRDKLKMASQCCNVSTCQHKPTPQHRESKAGLKKKTKSSKKPVRTTGRFKGGWENTEQDKDLGGKFCLTENNGVSGSHFILIENLEKDLSPSTIVDFINNQVSVHSQAQLFPSLSFEPYARGVIVVDSQEELQKLADFLDNPAHIISSSRGRPWVITEKRLRHGLVGTPGAEVSDLTTLSEIYPWDASPEVGENIKIFSTGTAEYNRGKRLRELFLKFAEHRRNILKKFALEETKIMPPIKQECTHIC